MARSAILAPLELGLRDFIDYHLLTRRYNRQGVTFTFDRAAKQSHYDGAAWREIIQRYPKSPEAAEARKRLEALTSRQKP